MDSEHIENANNKKLSEIVFLKKHRDLVKKYVAVNMCFKGNQSK